MEKSTDFAQARPGGAARFIEGDFRILRCGAFGLCFANEFSPLFTGSDAMKKNLMAVALLGVLASAAHAQSSVTLYGLIDVGITYTNSQLTSHGGHSNWQETSCSADCT